MEGLSDGQYFTKAYLNDGLVIKPGMIYFYILELNINFRLWLLSLMRK